VNNWKSVSKDRGFIQRARHDDDASIYEDISSRILFSSSQPDYDAPQPTRVLRGGDVMI
jgi:hypothetical protein